MSSENIFVPVRKEVFEGTFLQLKDSREFVEFYRKAFAEHVNFRNFSKEIIFFHGACGASLEFQGYPENSKDPFKGQKILYANLYILSEDKKILGEKCYVGHELAQIPTNVKSIDVLFKGLYKLQEKHNAECFPVEEEMSEFEKRWGRPRYPEEPKKGFAVPVFRPTENDDGKVVVNGYMLDPEKHFEIIKNFPLILDPGLLQKMEDKTNGFARSLARISRDEYAFRLELGREETFFAIENFFDRTLDPEILRHLSRQKHYTAFVDDHPQTGEPCLMAKLSGTVKPNVHEEKVLYILATKNDEVSFKRLVGQILLKPIPGEVYKVPPISSRKFQTIQLER